MSLKKIISGVVISGLLLSGVAAYAAGDSESRKPGVVKSYIHDVAGKEGMTKKAISFEALTEQELTNIAKKLGIDTQGLTKEQIVEKLKENKINHGAFFVKKPLEEATEQELANIAAKMGIDIEGLTKEQIIAKLKEAQKSAMLKAASEMGIDTQGLTDEQIAEKIREKKGVMIKEKKNME